MKRCRLTASLLIIGCTRCHCFLSSPTLGSGSSNSHPSSTQGILSSKKDIIAEDYDDKVELSEVSDAEALLACRAYLQRKNRLTWHQAKERKELRTQTRQNGFFWESPEQIAYWNKREEEDVDFDQGEETSGDEEVASGQEGPGIFTEMPTGPNERSEIRSRVKKEQWQDPEFIERWYEGRWGDHVKLSEESKKQQKLQSLLLDIPPSVIESPEFSMLTEDEIDEAIRSYVISNRKRSVTRKKQNSEKTQQQEPKELRDDYKALHRNSLFSVTEEHLREQQRKRAERSQKAYQTRIANAKNKATKPTIAPVPGWKPDGESPKDALIRIVSDVDAKEELLREQQRKRTERSQKAYQTRIANAKNKAPKPAIAPGPEWKPDGESPKDALIRIVSDLDANSTPSLVDVETIMEAKRLSRRKVILVRILNDQFDLRGKCLPIEDESKIYATQGSNAQLGKFVIELMTNRAS